MSARTISLIVLLPVIFCGVIYCVCRWDVIKLDGVQGELLVLIAPPDTRYSPYYTHTKFAQVKTGMNEEEVLRLLGEPLVRWHPYCYTKFTEKAHYTALQYSESPTSTHYRLRQVYLDNGKVAEIIAYYYID